MRKINPARIVEEIESLKIKKPKQERIKLPEQKPDTFEYVNKAKNKDDEMATMQFKMQRIEFYPEDLAKMEKMSHREKMEYVIRLRQEKKYIVIHDDK